MEENKEIDAFLKNLEIKCDLTLDELSHITLKPKGSLFLDENHRIISISIREIPNIYSVVAEPIITPINRADAATSRFRWSVIPFLPKFQVVFTITLEKFEKNQVQHWRIAEAYPCNVNRPYLWKRFKKQWVKREHYLIPVIFSILTTLCVLWINGFRK